MVGGFVFIYLGGVISLILVWCFELFSFYICHFDVSLSWCWRGRMWRYVYWRCGQVSYTGAKYLSCPS